MGITQWSDADGDGNADITLRSTPRVGNVNANIDFANLNNSGVVWGTALKPNFYPIKPPAQQMSVTAVALQCSTLLAASSVGAAIYSVSYTAAGTFTASLVAYAGTAIATTSTGRKVGSLNTTANLDFNTNHYLIGFTCSHNATQAMVGTTPGNSASGSGFLVGSGFSAMADVVSWVSSFDQSKVAASTSGERALFVNLMSANGALWL